MKKVTLLCGLLLALTASIASAAPGVNLKWTDCFGDLGATNRNFTCTTNGGSNVLVASFELGAALPGVSGLEVVIDLASAASPLPAWWGFKNAGTCRTGSLGVIGAPPGADVVCQDWSGGLAQGTSVAAYQIGISGPNTARILEVTAVPAGSGQDLAGATEYFAIQTTINNAKTVGTGSCAGCSSPVCIICNSIKCATPPVAGQPSRDVLLSGPTDVTGTSNFATWQGGLGVIVQGRPSGCPQAVPTHTNTWSSVKGLYR
jgi:hypothetical protein